MIGKHVPARPGHGLSRHHTCAWRREIGCLLFCEGYFVYGILLQHGNRSVCSTYRHIRVAAEPPQKGPITT
jgi:hypothetical protein